MGLTISVTLAGLITFFPEFGPMEETFFGSNVAKACPERLHASKNFADAILCMSTPMYVADGAYSQGMCLGLRASCLHTMFPMMISVELQHHGFDI